MRIDEPTSIIVFRNGSIGNTLVALPVLKALKARFPDAKLTAVLDPVGSELLENCEFLDTIVTYDKRGRDKGFSAHCRLIRKLRAARPSHAILLKRFFRNGLLAYLSGAKFRIGFETEGKAPFLNHTILYDESFHIAQLNLNLLSLLGIHTKAEPFALPLSEADRRSASEALSKRSSSRKCIVLHYGGSTTSPYFFPVHRMTELLKTVIGDHIELVLIGAGEQERKLAEALVASLGVGRLLFDFPIRTMAAIIESAQLFVGFNSGPAHIASGVKTAGCVFYRPDEAVDKEITKWRPMYDGLKSLVPPVGDHDIEWKQFLDDATLKLQELLSQISERS